MKRSSTLLVIAVATLATWLTGGPSLCAEVVHVEATAFGSPLTIAAEPGPSGPTEPALLAALQEVLELESLTDPAGDAPGGIGVLNSAPRGSYQDLDPRVAALLARSLTFCEWSNGAHGPLGGNLYALWGLRRTVGSFPSPSIVQKEVDNAACDKLELTEDGQRAALLGSGRLELWGFATGFAVDRAVVVLTEHDLDNGWVELGHIVRAFGPGPEGDGWPMVTSLGLDNTTERVLLRDRAMALVSFLDGSFDLGGERYAPYLDQRTGRPHPGTLGVAAVSEIALDAQALAVTLFVMPNREGRFRVGVLEPQPAIMWFLGSGKGTPLIAEHRWATLPKWEPPKRPLALPAPEPP